MRREAERVVALLSDKKRTAIHLVTTAEEMPVNETMTMAERVKKELAMPLGSLFINRLHTERFRTTDVDQVRRAAKRARNANVRAALESIAARAAEESSWTKLNRENVNVLAKNIDLPRIELPFVYSEEFGENEVAQLVAIIEAKR